jgi:hypothetical protein
MIVALMRMPVRPLFPAVAQQVLQEFLNLDLELLKRENAVVYDVKGILQGSDAKL